MSLDETTFEAKASEILQRLMDNIEDALGDDMDVDMQGGILTLELDSGGQYVINKHAPNKQIWVSSPKSGATHSDYDGDRDTWVSARGGDDLVVTLASELKSLTGKDPGI